MAKIHPTAIVSPKAQIDDSVEIGPFCVVEDDVIIGAGTKLSYNVCVYKYARIGKNNNIHQAVSIGNIPQDLKFGKEFTECIIGDNNTIREFVTIHRGTNATRKTTIGNNCFIMNFAHIAHDCVIENNCVIANCVEMAGHVHIEEYAILGGLVAIHQFTRIGKHVMVGGMSRMAKDALPYAIYGKTPTICAGINLIGLKRRNFPPEVISALHTAFNFLLNKSYNTSQAIEMIKNNVPMVDEVKYVLDFINNSQRGFLK